MKKLLKMSLLGLVMGIALTSCNGCGNSYKKAPETIDTNKVDTAATDLSKTKNDTSKTDTIKNKDNLKK